MTLVTWTAISAASAVDVFVSAATGQPYAIAAIEIPVEPPIVGQALPPIAVDQAEGRALYPISYDVRVKVPPASERPVPAPGRGRLINRVGNLIRELSNNEEDLEQTVARRVMFLIRGDDPLRIQLRDATGEIGTYDIVPQNDPAAHQQLLADWWSGLTEATRRQIDSAAYPPLVESYLVAMLSGRLNLPLPAWYTNTDKQDDELLSTLKLIAGAGEVSNAIFRRAAAGDTQFAQTTSFPLPRPPIWAPLYNADHLNGIPVEPLATRVPPECFYIRYGSFENYLWFRDLSTEYGGDITSMITVRGIADPSAARIESQLNLKTNELSRMFGPQVIEDQAIIGTDMFMGDGASIGTLIKAKNAFLLRTTLAADRGKLAAADPTITLKNLKIADRPVTLLSSADNRVRSFLGEDDGYLFVTNSETLMRRFFEVGKSGQSLAGTAAFRLSRQLMPLEREDTLFAYFSPEMLRGLVSPQYLIELRRRLLAKSDIALVHLAGLAAAGEGFSAEGIDELIDVGFLPAGFGHRPDHSGVVRVGDEVIDTLRGARGTFLPIADVKIDSVTAEEAAWYESIAAQYSARFPTIDPVMVGVQRSPIPDAPGLEQITVHAEIAPWEPEKYGWIAQQLGPPTQVAMEFAPDDIVAVQAHVASEQLGPPTHLFAAIKDTIPPEPKEFEGILNIYRSLRSIPGYLGAWPQPGALDRLPLGLGRGQPVGPGMSRLIGGLYRYTGGGFSILSFQPEVLEASLPFLAAVEANDTAQARIHIGNLHGSRIENWVNAQLYPLAAEGSNAGANFLEMLARQLKVTPQEAPVAAEQVLGTPLQCTLGGDYQYAQRDQRWYSTAWQTSFMQANAPQGYVSPVLKWFRGADATLTQYADRLVADATIYIQRQPPRAVAGNGD